jgi:hypothetical protein
VQSPNAPCLPKQRALCSNIVSYSAPSSSKSEPGENAQDFALLLVILVQPNEEPKHGRFWNLGAVFARVDALPTATLGAPLCQ